MKTRSNMILLINEALLFDRILTSSLFAHVQQPAHVVMRISPNVVLWLLVLGCCHLVLLRGHVALISRLIFKLSRCGYRSARLPHLLLQLLVILVVLDVIFGPICAKSRILSHAPCRLLQQPTRFISRRLNP